jgi:hypothetical protein
MVEIGVTDDTMVDAIVKWWEESAASGRRFPYTHDEIVEDAELIATAIREVT